ncbi:MAG: von Willebrand factor type [Pseudonocardiales bacterium]|nr:von Willebrand factor type [Pseudonocardiales bacterium]
MTKPQAARAPRIVPFAAAIIAAILLIVGVRACTAGGGNDSDKGDQALRDDCQTLNITVSSEKAALMRDMANDFNGEGKDFDGTCGQVRVTSKASGGAATALAEGWDEEADGPRPDVWSPASSAWLGVYRQQASVLDNGDVVGDTDSVRSVSQSPLVIAMPKPMAQALGWPAKQIGWTDLAELATDPSGWGKYGHAEWGAFKLGKTNPQLSTSGLNATIAAYYAATGRSTDLTLNDLADPTIQGFVRGIEQSVVHYGDTTLTFAENLYKAAESGQGLNYISAATLEEKSVYDYNVGNPSGDPQTLGDSPAPKIPLVAIYPSDGTLISDSPYTILDADWMTDTKRDIAESYYGYITADGNQKRFSDAGFRRFDGEASGNVSEKHGLNPKADLQVIRPPNPVTLTAIVAGWENLRKRANVLIVLDTSGSMGDPVSGTGSNRLDLARDAAAQAIDRLADDDILTLWAFSTPLGNSKDPYRVLVPAGPVASVRDAYLRQVDALYADGGTALYATTRQAVKSVQNSFDPTKINAVVLLTDGRNEYPQDNSLSNLVKDLDTEDTSRQVRVFPIAYGADADLDALKEIAEATDGRAYDASNPKSINNVLINVISNF